jgi:hypothetical protein
LKSIALAVALVFQVGLAESSGPAADPAHLRYERDLALPADASGQACALLDASVFAHAASAGANDVRLFASARGAAATEQPFNLSESEAQPADVETAQVRNLGVRKGDVVFDLVMPQRPYTEVDLNLDAQNFVAVATVTAPASDGQPTSLGTFTLFDLTRQRLARSTTLPLQEATFPLLHVVLHVTSLDGRAVPGLAASMVRGANVPPSREAQTLYTNVASVGSFVERNRQTIATLHVPAHVPIERVAFVLTPSFTGNFYREVAISAAPGAPASPSTDFSPTAENVAGAISRVHLAEPANPSAPSVHTEQLTVDAALGVSLDAGSTVTVTIANGDDPPLPLESIALQMRRRTLCFHAAASDTYTLLYGDAALHPPVYDYARLFQPVAAPVVAALGPEQLNPRFIARADERPYTERHPELLWIGLFAIVAALGASAVQTVKRQGKE